jgi:hypothetical protein
MLQSGSNRKKIYIYIYTCIYCNIHSGSGTMLQTGRSRDRFPMRWIFCNVPNPSGRTMALESTHPLTEMSTRNLKKKPGGKGRPANRADNLSAIC